MYTSSISILASIYESPFAHPYSKPLSTFIRRLSAPYQILDLSDEIFTSKKEEKGESEAEIDIRKLNPLTDSDYFEEVGVLILHNK